MLVLVLARHILRLMRHIFVILLTFTVVIELWLACWLYLPRFIADQAERGQFGDQFGTVNSLFAGLAFAAVALTLYYQFKESGRLQMERIGDLARRDTEAQAQEQRYQHEIARREVEFAKQTRLQALTAYAELSKELWLHCEKERDAARGEDKERFDFWLKSGKSRYDQTMEAHAELEKVLKENR